ncbi:3-oxoacyl-ACP synthase III family protein [Pseudenhygromyxa sp. WMMC2535]|uniref:3-oxoacyl-ACP synthase III family protein n=1 Tax=Pseudenhygromyxa sp. WMMC2535 TaxID=2712867 RepID=UPI001554873C|nr:3-oxoacyl-ACP synthase III family protein [Pseudenhygromyxa sp. WMMC2535]NVB37324.1 3-oxoacyl-ACP synthase III family protein [Pseudenhygromyxa sp. WMMC2535]
MTASLREVALRSLAVAVPERVRTNAELAERHPELVRRPERGSLDRIMTNAESRPEMAKIDASILPYIDDPFRGVVERRSLSGDETSIGLEVAAGREAIARAGLAPADIDLLISVGFLPHHVGIGNAVYVARELGLRGAAWNLESACAGPLNALQNAFALVRAGEYARVLVTVSCAYTRFAREDDTLSWFLGDGAGAFVIASEGPGAEHLSSYSMHTADTCGSWYYQLELDDAGAPARVMRAHPDTGKLMRGTVEKHLRRCCEGALERAGLALGDIDFFVFHTPTAWFRDFACAALGVDPQRAANCYQHYANVGPALTPINLHYAAVTEKIAPGARVLVYGPGSVSSAAAMILRWGEVGLGPVPAKVSYS